MVSVFLLAHIFHIYELLIMCRVCCHLQEVWPQLINFFVGGSSAPKRGRQGVHFARPFWQKCPVLDRKYEIALFL